MCTQNFKAYLGMSIIKVKMNSLIMQATREEKSVLPVVAQGKSLVISSLVKEESTCSFFHVGDPCLNLKKSSFQQEELNKDLRASLFFQQREFDAMTTSLTRQRIEEWGLSVDMSNSCLFENDFEDMWFDLKIMLGGRLRGKMISKIDWGEILS